MLVGQKRTNKEKNGPGEGVRDIGWVFMKETLSVYGKEFQFYTK